jgi:hypothetical protein
MTNAYPAIHSHDETDFFRVMPGFEANVSSPVHSGVLRAKGIGSALVHIVDGEISLSGESAEAILVRKAKTLQVNGKGNRRELQDGTLFWGWKGEIKASGTDLTVQIRGGKVRFTANGTGRMFVQGKGNYKVNGDEEAWQVQGTFRVKK